MHPPQIVTPLSPFGVIIVTAGLMVKLALLTSNTFKSAVLLTLIKQLVDETFGTVQFCEPSLVVLVVIFTQVTPLSIE